MSVCNWVILLAIFDGDNGMQLTEKPRWSLRKGPQSFLATTRAEQMMEKTRDVDNLYVGGRDENPEET
jgi:hypothetical protein